jgi:hypothetical protein
MMAPRPSGPARRSRSRSRSRAATTPENLPRHLRVSFTGLACLCPLAGWSRDGSLDGTRGGRAPGRVLRGTGEVGEVAGHGADLQVRPATPVPWRSYASSALTVQSAGRRPGDCCTWSRAPVWRGRRGRPLSFSPASLLPGTTEGVLQEAFTGDVEGLETVAPRPWPDSRVLPQGSRWHCCSGTHPGSPVVAAQGSAPPWEPCQVRLVALFRVCRGQLTVWVNRWGGAARAVAVAVLPSPSAP